MEKKKLIVFLCFLSMSMIAYADSKITLKSGDISVFEKTTYAQVVFDYSKAEIEDKEESLDDFIEKKGYKYENNWELAQKMSHKDFIKRFNKKSVGLKLNSDSTEETKYKVIISVRTINMGNTAKSLIPFGSKKGGGLSMFGYIYVKDHQGNKLCSLRFSDIQGLGEPSIIARLIATYEELNNTLQRFLKKSKSKTNKETEEDEEEINEEETEE